VTCFDPCIMTRPKPLKPEPEPAKLPNIKFPADEKGNPLEMEYHPRLAPPTPVPFLARRFRASSMEELDQAHGGVEEKIDVTGGKEHLEHGWTKENDKKFRENEELCRALFGTNWDGRYGRTRVRSTQTGELLSWGDGSTIYDSDVAFVPTAPPSGVPPATVPPAFLKRGDTERVLSQNVSRISKPPPAPLSGEPRIEAFPYFPPPKMHVASAKAQAQMRRAAAPRQMAADDAQEQSASSARQRAAEVLAAQQLAEEGYVEVPAPSADYEGIPPDFGMSEVA